MMTKTIHSWKLSDTLSLAECTDGFWLYDKTRGMNLSMRAKTRDDAFVEALTYYQNRLTEAETNYRILHKKVDEFVALIVNQEDNDD